MLSVALWEIKRLLGERTLTAVLRHQAKSENKELCPEKATIFDLLK